MSILIHNKEYITVAERVQEAHKDEAFESLDTEVLYQDPVVVKATVKISGKDDKGNYWSKTFTGISAANPSKQIEKMSPYEVAETSAVGRALGFAGYGIVEGIASADEMVKSGAKEEDNFAVENTAICSTHKVTMRHFEKEGREWWSHRLADGTWCNGKPTNKVEDVDPSYPPYEDAN